MISKLKIKKNLIRLIYELKYKALHRYLHGKRSGNSCRSSSATNLSHPRVRAMLQVLPSSILKVCGQFYDTGNYRDKFPPTWHSWCDDEARMDGRMDRDPIATDIY